MKIFLILGIVLEAIIPFEGQPGRGSSCRRPAGSIWDKEKGPSNSNQVLIKVVR